MSRIERTVMIWHEPCRRYISREDNHGCEMTHQERSDRYVERRIYTDVQRAKRAQQRGAA